ncbi:MAG: SPOR domain-containing protein [Bacteroidota bacterium]|jgi:cell division protein FtsN
MSKIDYITIAVVVICISLLGLVFWKVADLNWAEENIQETEESVQVDEGEEEAAPFLDENYDVTDFVPEDSASVPIETAPVVVPEEEKSKEKVNIKEPVIETKPLKIAEKEEVIPPVNTLKEEYLVWGGSFSTRLGAEEEQAKFKKLGYNKAEVSLFDKGKYAVVIVGRYPTQAQAQALVNELKSKHNISAIAKKKKL